MRPSSCRMTIGARPVFDHQRPAVGPMRNSGCRARRAHRAPWAREPRTAASRRLGGLVFGRAVGARLLLRGSRCRLDADGVRDDLCVGDRRESWARIRPRGDAYSVPCPRRRVSDEAPGREVERAASSVACCRIRTSAAGGYALWSFVDPGAGAAPAACRSSDVASGAAARGGAGRGRAMTGRTRIRVAMGEGHQATVEVLLQHRDDRGEHREHDTASRRRITQHDPARRATRSALDREGDGAAKDRAEPHHGAATENATEANWSMPSDPTRRMPSGEKRRSTMRKTAAVGTPIRSTQSMPLSHRTAVDRPAGEERDDERHQPHAHDARARGS